MVEAHRLGRQHRGQSLPLSHQRLIVIRHAPPEIGGEHFKGDQRIAGSDRRHGAGEQAGAVIGEIIAGHRREHHITELHRLNGIGHPLGFGGIHRHRGLALVHLAEGTAAGADRATQEKRRRSGGVALAAVGAAPLLTDGVEPVLLHQPLHPLQLRGVADRPPQPVRQSLGRGDGAVLAHTGRRPSRALLRVTSSAYSSSLPIGRP